MTATESLRQWLHRKVAPKPLEAASMRAAESAAEGWVMWDVPGSMTTDMWRVLMTILGVGNFSVRHYQGVGMYATGQLDVSPDGVARLNKFMADA